MNIRSNIEDITIKVMLWGKCIGVLKWDKEKDLAIFQFTKDYINDPINITPTKDNKSVGAFYGNKNEKYQGLPEFIADSLPDDWGNILFDEWLTKNKIPSVRSNSLLKLAFIGKRGIGALEYLPEVEPLLDSNTAIDINALHKMAEFVYKEKQNLHIAEEQEITLSSLIELGTSVGGKHPKGIVARNRSTNEFRSGQVSLPSEYTYYILKFKENPDIPTSEIEMIYYEMAVEAGIRMMPSELIEINGMKHFMTERFDRVNGEKLHTQTMAAIIPNGNDYSHLFFLCENLGVPYEDKEQLFRQIVFNHAAGVTDDHNKNFSFIMNKKGEWRIAPAYDVMFTANIWENPSASVHCLGLAGKRTHITIQDLSEFAEDFEIKNYKNIINQVLKSISNFHTKCEKYQIAHEWESRISNSLKVIFPFQAF